MVFDLGACANRVVVFGPLDHGPALCESLEHTVYFADDPTSRDVTGWTRAALSKVFTHGVVDLRPADPTGHASCGDTAAYAAEMDAMAIEYALPSGMNKRYVAIVAGYDGLDVPACEYESNDHEVDAVAGLTEMRLAISASTATCNPDSGMPAGDVTATGSHHAGCCGDNDRPASSAIGTLLVGLVLARRRSRRSG
jgi:hypothetical protein